MNPNLTSIGAALVVVMALQACRDREHAPPEPPPMAAEDGHPVLDPPLRTITGEDVIGFHGFGPARFGDDEESVRIAWGRPLTLSGNDGDSCRYLFPEPRPSRGYGIAFMLVDGRFVRYDVDSDRYTAPGGLVAGSQVAQVEKAHGDRIERRPHKYVDGAEYLVVTPADGGEARLVFETNGEGLIKSWRLGVPPPVHYVEGCS